jgi:hypothetical protein
MKVLEASYIDPGHNMERALTTADLYHVKEAEGRSKGERTRRRNQKRDREKNKRESNTVTSQDSTAIFYFKCFFQASVTFFLRKNCTCCYEIYFGEMLTNIIKIIDKNWSKYYNNLHVLLPSI